MGCAASSPSTAYREEHSSDRGESSKNSAEKYRSNTKGQQGLLQVKGNTTGATHQQQRIEEGDTIPLDSYSPQILQNRRQQQHRTGSIVTDHNCSGGGADNATEDNQSYFGNSSAIAMNSAMPRSSSLLVLHNNQQHQSNAAIDTSAEENAILASAKNTNAPYRRTSKESQQQQRHRRESLELGMSPNVAAAPSGKQNQRMLPGEEVDPQRRTSLISTSQAGISQEIVYQETIVRATKENNAIEAAMMERAHQQQQLLSPKYRAVSGSGNSSRGEATSEGGSQELKTSQGPQLSSVFHPLGLPSHHHSKGDQSDDLSTPVDPLGGHYLHHHHRINSLDEGESATHSSSRGGGMGGVGGPRKRSFNPSHMTFGDVDEDDHTFTRHDGSGGGQQNPLRAAGGGAGGGGGGGESYSRSTRGLEEMLVSPTSSGEGGEGGKFNIISPKYNAAVVIAVLQVPTPEANRGLVATTGAGGTLSNSDRSNDHPLLDDNDPAAHSTRTFLMQALPPAASSS
ncbi:Hypothetical protein, putative [Bodo saltans]|uniref:Uncharacterized protein n=1 Tax=Bodo saltans TaxID=75058 RepID=A0A0S4JE89_BODSA|nr:Hypothetical protein, putative [Bodo saltans]|eukprot:CUG89887.1 Hypothetical protein, putative [Bodo saltans]